jgi:hypothetical protein
MKPICPNRAIAVALIFIGLLAASAHAQTFGPAWESNITLTQEDLDLIHRTVDTQVHARPVGTTVAWSNPNTGNAGTIKLLKRFNRGNLRCEQNVYTLTTTKKAVEPEHYVFNSCLTPEGWRIALYADKPFLLNTSVQVSQRSLYPVSSGPG